MESTTTGSPSNRSVKRKRVPLDEHSTGFTRPMVEILHDLNKPVTHDKVSPDKISIPWHRANEILNIYAPGWYGEVRDVKYSDNGRVTVVYRVTIIGSDGQAHREAIGTTALNDDRYKDPEAEAEETAFAKACARFGLGLHLYNENKLPLMKFYDCWLEIIATINFRTLSLSPDTDYEAYLIFQTTKEAEGLGINQEAYVVLGKKQKMMEVCLIPTSNTLRDGSIRLPSESTWDNWMELKLGEFYCHAVASYNEVEISIREIDNKQGKTGLTIAGMEIRPKAIEPPIMGQ